MAHFVQSLNNEGVINNLFADLSTAYTANLTKLSKENKENASFPEVTEWEFEHRKRLAEKDFHGLFLLCFKARNKIFDSENIDGIPSPFI